MSATDLLASFGTVKGELAVGGTPLSLLAARVGSTPFFAYDRRLLTERVAMLRSVLPDALDLLVICAEAGLTVDAAFHRVAKELGRAYPELGDEFQLTAIELGFLTDRRQAFENLAMRVDLDAVKGVVTTMIQTEKYGTPLASALRVLSAEKSGKQSLDVAGLLKIRGSEIQQRYSELMMLAAGPAAVPLMKEAMAAGWQPDQTGATFVAPLAGTYFNMRKTTIYGGSNEVQRNIVAQTVLGS